MSNLISDEELKDELIRLKEELGTSPRYKDMEESGKYSTGVYNNRFGSWNESLMSAGLEVNERSNISEKGLIREFNRVSEELFDGATPRLGKWRKSDFPKFSVTAYMTEFGGWKNVCKEAGYKLNKKSNLYTEEELLSEMRSVSNKRCNGKPPRRDDMTKYGNYGSKTYERRFSSWNEALEKAGFDGGIGDDMSKEDLLEEIEEVSEKYCGGKTPRGKDMKTYGEYSLTVYYNNFDSWENAVEEAGFEANSHYTYTEEELIKEIKRLSHKFADGGRVSWTLMEKEGQISAKTFENRFGSWEQAVKISGFAPYIPPSGEDSPVWKEGWNGSYYGPSWRSQRKNARERDKYKCRICHIDKYNMGENPSVHHISPKYNWNVEEEHEEMNDLSNLISLCPSCHQKLEGKWQDASPDEFVERGRDYFNIDNEQERSLLEY